MGISLKGLANKAKSVASKVASKIAKPNGPNSGFGNIGATLKAAVSGKGVSSNTGIKSVDKVLAKVASHPFATAGVAGTIANIPKALSLVKGTKSASKATSKFAEVSRPTSQPGLIKPAAGGVISPTMAQNKTQPSEPGLITADTVAGGAYTGSKSSTATRRKSSTKRRSSRVTRKRRSSKKRTKKRYGTAKQYARKGGKTVRYAPKTGQPYIVKANGQWQFVKGKRRKSR